MKRKGGFTLIEVSLFLALTGVLLFAVTIGVQNSIFQQRYNDSVQDFAEFLRRVYSDVENVQSVGNGRSDYAIYGDLVTFGETMDLSHSTINVGKGIGSQVFVYDVIGKIGSGSGSDNTIVALGNLGANVALVEDGSARLAGVAESYKPKWSAQIQDVAGNNFKGALLIVRHPQSGTMSTYAMIGDTIEVNQKMKTSGKNVPAIFTQSVLENLKTQEVNFCISPNDGTTGFQRMDVKIKAGARNSSGIEIFDDSDENPCRNK